MTSRVVVVHELMLLFARIMMVVARIAKERKRAKRNPDELMADLATFQQQERWRLKWSNIPRNILLIICGTHNMPGMLTDEEAYTMQSSSRRWWQTYVGVPVSGPLLYKIQALDGKAIFISVVDRYQKKKAQNVFRAERYELARNKIAFQELNGQLIVHGPIGIRYIFTANEWWRVTDNTTRLLKDGRQTVLDFCKYAKQIPEDMVITNNNDPELATAIQMSLETNMTEAMDITSSGNAHEFSSDEWLESGLDGFKDSLKKLN
jgi:hypothetical protein